MRSFFSRNTARHDDKDQHGIPGKPGIAVNHLLLAALLGIVPAGFAYGQVQPSSYRFDIAPQSLADALDEFSTQSSLQIIYDLSDLGDVTTVELKGQLDSATALDRLLAATSLQWSLVDNHTVVVSKANVDEPRAARQESLSGNQGLTDMLVERDAWGPGQIEPSAAIFGFHKSIMETPRSVSVIGQDLADQAGLSSAEDLVRFVPSVFTPARFGIQGSVDVRNNVADSYFRGMKRLNLKGHARSILGSADTIEIVRGPPSPIYGMGKVGGYTNITPKSGRARMGSYQSEASGFGQISAGSFNHSELSFGVGGPLQVGSRRGGYYLYGLLENSGTYTRNVDVNHKLVQLTFTLDDLPADWRMETGFNYQRSATSGALLNRVTQQLVDADIYIRGEPLANLDLNHNGSIGFLEMHAASPVAGQLSSDNQPLIQRWTWPVDQNGDYYPLGQFPAINGIPQTLFDYLQTNPGADPTGLLRGQGAGGPLPVSGRVPVGFALDPRSVTIGRIDRRNAGAFEREVQAELALFYFDLIKDFDPEFTIKNQFFVDSMDQYKVSEQPGGGKQDVLVIEDRLTMTRQFRNTPSWLAVNSLFAFNFRNTHASGYRYGGDHGSHRNDAYSMAGTLPPNASFAHPFDNPDLANDGAHWTTDYFTSYWELGAGFLFEIDMHDSFNLLIGARMDRSRARNVDYAGTLDANSGTSAEPGVIRIRDSKAQASDSGVSWNVSLSYRFDGGIMPYLTMAESSLTLEGNNNRIQNDVIEQGHIGKARLQEAGIKFNLVPDSLQLSVLYFQQSRVDLGEDEIDNSPSELKPTEASGWEAELQWAWRDRLHMSLYALQQKARFKPQYGRYVLVDARTLGYQDVLDLQGNVIYPAEAFLYGGRSFLQVPDDMPGLEYRQGIPERQVGFHLGYRLSDEITLAVDGNHFSSTYSGTLKQVWLPSSTVINFSVLGKRGAWQYRINLLNAFDRRYFQPRSGDNLGETLITAMPGRQARLSLRYSF